MKNNIFGRKLIQLLLSYQTYSKIGFSPKKQIWIFGKTSLLQQWRQRQVFDALDAKPTKFLPKTNGAATWLGGVSLNVVLVQKLHSDELAG